ncbi:MAG: RNA 3'-terminal phosphate cyclase [Candidatus Promineifilaceae bacterium]|nr:RNA 3'-terminal phosphate cyclase [Candidatus Promineifilaceae bacterium]
MKMMTIDGSQGEGGGQMLRTGLSLSATTGRPLRLINIRAGRSKPGLRPQHLTAVRAVAATCDAEVEGDTIDSQELTFYPAGPPHADDFIFNVEEAARHGSAGAVTLIFQAILWPLVFADSPSRVVLRGGTHVPFSPPYHYLAEVARPAFARFRAYFDLSLNRWGWAPAGKGEIAATIRPVPRLEAATFEPVAGGRVHGVAAVTNLPSHIPQRMAGRAHNLLREAGLKTSIQPLRETAEGPGAGIFLWLPQAGFGALGRQGLPSETVAETAVAELLAFIENESAAVDAHLANQLLLPMALAHGTSSLTTDRLTRHTLTNAEILRRWLDVTITVEGELGEPGTITVEGAAFTVEDDVDAS